MKKSQRKNSPTPETRFMFLDDNYWECWECGQNHADCLHHITGRGYDEGCEKSPFNLAPINNHFCHLPNHGRLMTDKGQKRLLEKTIEFLSRRGYTLTKIDEEFLTKYEPLYKRLKVKI